MTYSIRRSHLIRLLWYWVLGSPRSIATEAERALKDVAPPPQARTTHLIPAEGPLVVVANHYERPGLWVAWGGTLITQAIGRRRPESELHWMMTGEWTRARLGPFPVPECITRLFLERVAKAARAVVMEPDESRTRRRARALRQITDLLSSPGGNHVVGIFPEGPVSDSRLVAMKGAGSFLYHLSKRGFPIQPVGIGEEAGVLVANFGRPMSIEMPRGLARSEQDAEAGRLVMKAIARLLPSAERPIPGPNGNAT